MCCWLWLHHLLPVPALASAAQAVAELEKQGYNPEVRGSIAHALMAMLQCDRLRTSTTPALRRSFLTAAGHASVRAAGD